MQETKNILVIVFVSNLTNCAHKERSNERGFILMRNTDRTCIALGRVRIRNRRENGIFKGLMACYLGLLKREGKNGQVLWILGISEAEKRHSHALWGRSFPWRFERFEHFTQSRVCFSFILFLRYNNSTKCSVVYKRLCFMSLFWVDRIKSGVVSIDIYVYDFFLL